MASPAVTVPLTTLPQQQKVNHAQVVLTKPKPQPPQPMQQTHQSIPQAVVKPETKVCKKSSQGPHKYR